MLNDNSSKTQTLDEFCAHVVGLRTYHAEGVDGFFILKKEDFLVRFRPTRSDTDAAFLLKKLDMGVHQKPGTSAWVAHLNGREVENTSLRGAVTAAVADAFGFLRK